MDGLVTQYGRIALRVRSHAQCWTLTLDGLKPGAALRLAWPDSLPRPDALQSGPSVNGSTPLEWDEQELPLLQPDAHGHLEIKLKKG